MPISAVVLQALKLNKIKLSQKTAIGLQRSLQTSKVNWKTIKVLQSTINFSRNLGRYLLKSKQS